MAHRHGVYRFGLQVCRTTEDAEDAVQETLWAAQLGISVDALKSRLHRARVSLREHLRRRTGAF
jgi:DNA-directed RNA polymerase specialized sigma24 family protein